ncbi:FGGY-family carbohydrate kinase [Subtercola boreus]|uniref:Carbohydrate kinase n=1 Tax=Subtercola boreus TaxID=120213 RepID=A0A3E0WA72_9MICO|nr:FGGY-family carbohydrate kinase [Subtercola boreus]RFA20826.1 carbohydrate kinase [Subtercola boreus]RFA20941.1 carbohydrate kinase [Subtercola boreus]RFA27134.1 carbohydrate kinase [Subtercola boreus]
MIVGVDIGTSITKASAIFHDGRVGATASMPSRLIQLSGGRVEQDLENVLDSVASVVRRIVASATEPIEAVALTGQGDGLWLRDHEGRAVRPMISWMDARAADTIEEWNTGGASSVSQQIFRLTGSGIFPGCHAALLHWLAQNEPESLAHAAVAGYCVDAVIHNLTGVITVDASDASLPFMDVTTGQYVPGALELCGIGEWAHLLPAPAGPGALFRLDDRGADLLGLPVGTPVTGGPYDLQACGFGSGTTRSGEGTLVVGTTLSCQVLTEDRTIPPDADPAGMWLCTPEPGLYLRVMPSMVGTASIDWLLGLFELAPEALNDLLLLSAPGADGVSALSFLSPAGERAPFVDPLARGQFSGIQLRSTRADIVRALCEGLAFAARHCFEVMGLSDDVAACGGGLKSEEWAHIFADVLGRPLYLPDDAAVGARGAAMIAWAQLGRPVDSDLWRAQRRRIDPDLDRAALYNTLYGEYQQRLDSARALWPLGRVAHPEGADRSTRAGSITP